MLYARVRFVLPGLFGVRRSSIASLRWENVPFQGKHSDAGPRIFYLSKNTAGGLQIRHKAMLTPGVALMAALLRNTLGSQDTSEWGFPQATTHTKHVSPDEFRAWLTDATTEARLTKLEGGVWHARRRGWARRLLSQGWDAQQVEKYGGWSLAAFH